MAAATDHLPALQGADVGRVVAVGHSAGGHLALWLAARPRLPAGAPGSGPRVRLRGAVSLAGVCDLVRGAQDGLGDGAVAELLGGGPDQHPDRYAAASPAALLPLGVPQVLVHGGRDAIVPPGQSRGYARVARAAGDRVELVELAEADHFDVVGASHADVALRALESLLP